VSDPLTQPLAPGQMPYHLRDGLSADPEVEARHRACLRAMETLQRKSPECQLASPSPKQ